MTSLVELQRLLNLNDLRRQRCEHDLQRTYQQLERVESERTRLVEQAQTLWHCIDGERADGSVLGHDQLLMLLRRQAVLRRQLQALAIDRARVDEEHGGLHEQLQTRQRQRQALLHKQRKFQVLRQRLKRIEQLTRLRREDNENEGVRLCAATTSDQEA